MTTRSRTSRPTAPRSPQAAGSVRIIGGQWKRRLLQVVDAPGLRPTPARVRETLFNWLTHAFDGTFEGRSALDLFAGSGALGIEAASRGATSVTLVENDPAALEALHRTRRALQAPHLDIRAGDATRVAKQLSASGMHFDVVFLDPPFGQRWLDNALPLAAALCKSPGFIYVEAESALPETTFARMDAELYRADKAGEVFYHLLRCNI